MCSLTLDELGSLMLYEPLNSPVYKALLNTTDNLFNREEHMLASLIDIGNLLIWSKTKDGQRNKNKPKPVKRPTILQDIKKKTFMADIEDIKIILERKKWQK